MSNPPESPERFSLSRWSRRKHEVAREKKEAPVEPAPVLNPAALAAPVAAPAPASEEPPLPPVESLTIDSDFRAFMGPKVDEETKRAALKKLFSDPHFNVMDGLDIYIGDYTKSDPMPEGMLAKIADVYNKLAEEGAAKPEAEAAAEGAASVVAAEEAAPPAPPPKNPHLTPRRKKTMTVADKTLFVCNCNKTMPLDGPALGRALGLPAPPTVHSMLCQRELARFSEGAQGDMLVACTQEQRLLGDVAEEGGRAQEIRFVNIRETAGWSSEAAAATPKIAALLAMAALPDPEPVPSVGYRSSGQILIAGPLDAALRWADVLSERLAVTVLATSDSPGIALPAERTYPVYSGRITALAGWLGAFEASWEQENPIDLDLCTRCNACLRACPEQAIDESYQIDLARCKDHRLCVAACGAVGAIDFARKDTSRSEKFDLVLDLGASAWFKQHQPPQGYFRPGADVAAQAKAAAELAGLTGEFEKPRFFQFKASLCAHSRSRIEGCTQCIDICSALAIRPDGDRIAVEPHLCVGCGACTTVCPSGALTYAYPAVPDLAARIKTLLATYARAGGRDACLLFHAEDGREAIARFARRGAGLPARVVPIEIEHIASTGIDVWLAAVAWGASQVAVLATGSEAPQYRAALTFQMTLADTIANALGYQGEHFRLVEANALSSLAAWPPALGPRVAATFAATPEKRTTAALAIEHLAAHAPTPRDVIPLPSGSPYGGIEINRDTCTMCLACVGSCPEAAIVDNIERPQVRLIESKCVQCGICASTCPEHAITLVPRLDLTAQAKAPRVLNEAVVVNCTRCGKPLGTQKMVEAMLARLANHSMFAEPGSLDRLRMCADCRVVDLIKTENSVDIRKL